MRQFIDLAYRKFLASSVVSDTFRDDLLKSVVSLFVVVNPIGKVSSADHFNTKNGEAKQETGFDKCYHYYCIITYSICSSRYSVTVHFWD